MIGFSCRKLDRISSRLCGGHERFRCQNGAKKGCDRNSHGLSVVSILASKGPEMLNNEKDAR